MFCLQTPNIIVARSTMLLMLEQLSFIDVHPGGIESYAAPFLCTLDDGRGEKPPNIDNSDLIIRSHGRCCCCCCSGTMGRYRPSKKGGIVEGHIEPDQQTWTCTPTMGSWPMRWVKHFILRLLPLNWRVDPHCSIWCGMLVIFSISCPFVRHWVWTWTLTCSTRCRVCLHDLGIWEEVSILMCANVEFLIQFWYGWRLCFLSSVVFKTGHESNQRWVKQYQKTRLKVPTDGFVRELDTSESSGLYLLKFIWVYHEKHHSPREKHRSLHERIMFQRRKSCFFPRENIIFPTKKHHVSPWNADVLCPAGLITPPLPIEPRPGCTQLQSDLVEWLGRMALRQRIDKYVFLIVSWLIQWISSRENLQETMGFRIKYLVFL